MTKEVLIGITGLQFDGTEDGGEEIKSIHPGEYYKKGNTHYVMFEESDDGIPDAVKNLLKVKENEVCMTKKGLINVNMVFEKGKKSMTSYHTPYGNLMMAMDTKTIEVKEEEDFLFAEIEYGLEVNYEFLADCHISIEVVSKEKGSEVFRP